MILPIRRLRPSQVHLAMLVGLAVTMVGVPPAQAQTGTLTQATGLSASQVKSAPVCPPAGPGQARCEAQTIVLRSNDGPVRPLVHPRASFTQVFPRTPKGVAPSTSQAGATAPQADTPAYLQQAYDLSYLSQTGGVSDTIAIVDAYDDPTAEADLGIYRATYGLPACTTTSGCFTKVNQQGTSSPLPTSDPDWETEISLDLDAVSALCPNCHILLVEADTTGLNDMDAGVVTANRMGAKQISASWSADSNGPITGTYTFTGVAVIAATGDGGYLGPSGGDSYPAALPGVTAAGGTSLTASITTTPDVRGFSESGWSLSGGWGGGSGCDLDEAKPAYQTDTGCSGRSYADVSADADPTTGLIIYDSGNGGWMLAGGTSLATPLIAAYDAVTAINGSTPQWAYRDSALLNDPTAGSNGTCAAAIFYICNAGAGYDGPTGAGSISGDVVSGAPGIGGPGIGSGPANTYTQSVTPTGATLTGGVYPNGVSTTYSWQYGITSAYGQQTAAVTVGSGPAPLAVTSSVSGLAPSTTYHYRLVAQNGDGTSYGYDYTLTTPASPPVDTTPPVITGSPRTGQTLTTTTGSWNPTGSYTYQWQRSTNTGQWTNITTANNATYTPTTTDLAAKLHVIITATNPYGSTRATSTPVGPVAAPARHARPSIAGNPLAPSRSSASAVLSIGVRILRNSRGTALGIATVGARAHRGDRNRTSDSERVVVVRRARGVHGSFRAWVCPAARTAGRALRRCTAHVRLGSVVSFGLRGWTRGNVRVILVRIG
jgi:subtilase family serine protease